MKDARMTGAVDVTEAEGRPATSEDCASEDWLWRAGGDRLAETLSSTCRSQAGLGGVIDGRDRRPREVVYAAWTFFSRKEQGGL